MARAVGMNHIAIEVGSLDEALEFYGSLFELELRGRIPGMAFIDMGDQFLALARADGQRVRASQMPSAISGSSSTTAAAVLAAAREAGVEIFGGNSFRDPWGNHVQVVEYGDIQFTKAPEILRGMGLELEKTESAQAELRDKGLHLIDLSHNDLLDLLVLLAAGAAMLVLVPKLRIPYPILLVLGGLALGFVPGLPEIDLPPDLVLVGVLPPLLYGAAFFTSLRDLRANVRPVGLLAVGLVLLTMVVVAVVAHTIVPGLPWAAAFVLGAVVSPTDPIASTAIMQRLGVPRRIVNIVEGESLVNDGTALVAYRFAVVAAVSGTFTLWEAGISFVLNVAGGVAVGLGVGWIVRQVRRHLDFPPAEVTISLLTGYFAYIPAELIGVSAVIAAVTAGDLPWLAHAGADDGRGTPDGRVGVGDRHLHAQRASLHADRPAAAWDPRRARRLLHRRPALVGGGRLADGRARARALGLSGGVAAAPARSGGSASATRCRRGHSSH